jgi:hypothetical protein
MSYEISTKECLLCHEIRPLSKFKVGRKIGEVCKSCNRNRAIKVCTNCAKEKYVNQFYRRGNIWGVCTQCEEEIQIAIKDGYDLGFKVLDKLKESLYTNDKDV